MRRVGRARRPHSRRGNEARPRTRSEHRRQRAASEAKESTWRSAEIVAAFSEVRDQFVGYVDVDHRLPGHGPELLHSFPGLIVQPAVDAALEAIQPPQF